MSASSQWKAWHCVGLVPVERLALFCCAQRGGSRDVVRPDRLDGIARRCCVGPNELRGVLLALHGKGHVTICPDWSVAVHPVVKA